jgi:hypothetical protein|tara:strand:+ start:90 stop:275 length:186 start_codon:yes stop_codon:yes gene_type:complete
VPGDFGASLLCPEVRVGQIPESAFIDAFHQGTHLMGSLLLHPKHLFQRHQSVLEAGEFLLH